jgi:hypothetical protein
MFWSPEKIAAWEAILFPHGRSEDGVELIENMITLSADAHLLWNQGAFALKPIFVSEDEKGLKVQLFWQVKHTTSMSISLTTVPQSTRGFDNYKDARLADYRQSPIWIKSGQFFDITTNDPTLRPLPSMALLEMQWFLQRIMGMAGAADMGVDMEDCYFSDDGMED